MVEKAEKTLYVYWYFSESWWQISLQTCKYYNKNTPPPPRPPQLCSWLPILSPEFVLHKLPLQLLSTLQKKFITSKQSGRAHGIVLILLHNRLEGGNQIFLIIFVKKITTYKNLVDRRSEMYISSSDLWWKNTDVHPPPPLESY